MKVYMVFLNWVYLAMEMPGSSHESEPESGCLVSRAVGIQCQNR